MSNLPQRVIVDVNGAYWRDYGRHVSMCPTSADNDPVEIDAIYELVAERNHPYDRTCAYWPGCGCPSAKCARANG